MVDIVVVEVCLWMRGEVRDGFDFGDGGGLSSCCWRFF